MKNWLHLYTEHIRHCMRQEKLRLRQNIQDIRSWIKTKPKDAKQSQPQTMPSQTPRKPKTQKPLHKFFRNPPTSTDITPKATDKTRTPTMLTRLRKSVHNAFIQTTLRIKHKTSHKAKAKEPQDSQLVTKKMFTTVTHDNHIPASHYGVKRNTTGLEKARGIKKFTRWRTSNTYSNTTRQDTEDVIKERNIGK